MKKIYIAMTADDDRSKTLGDNEEIQIDIMGLIEGVSTGIGCIVVDRNNDGDGYNIRISHSQEHLKLTKLTAI